MFQQATASWTRRWSQAYSFGHNAEGLHGNRLEHFAHAYADLTEDVVMPMSLEVFADLWERGSFFGTSDGNWHLATGRYVA